MDGGGLLFPAYAGVILCTGLGGGLMVSFPRVCGGDPEIQAIDPSVKDFSPRMRG